MNFILIEIFLMNKQIYVGGLYVPSRSSLLLSLINKHLNETCYIFGGFNTKYIKWRCRKSNTSGVQLHDWLEKQKNELVLQKASTKRSNSIIDFGMAKNAADWTVEVLDEGTFDHYFMLFRSSIAIETKTFFRITNWKLFCFFLSACHEYWLTLVYNLDERSFFDLFSLVLSSRWHGCSKYEKATKYRSPCHNILSL